MSDPSSVLGAGGVFRILPAPEARDLYACEWRNPGGDAGLDVRFARDGEIAEGETAIVGFGVRVAYFVGGGLEPSGYWLLPRSSLAKTPQVLMLRNHVGTIDRSYRGELKAAIHNFGPGPFRVSRGAALFQLVDPQMRPPVSVLAGESDPAFAAGATARAAGGFGSTGVGGQAAAPG